MREPVTYVEIEQDFCELVYSESPCMAALGVTGNEKCYNTLATCQDPENYRKGSLRLRYTKGTQPAPGVYGIPSVVSVDTAPTVINPGGGGKRSGPLGQRASLKVVLQDHPGSDILVDPYLDERGYDPLERGTYWTKWLARNPYYNNRIIRVREGYHGQPLDEMITRTYLIDRINGPDKRGRVTITAKDVLRLADDDKAQAPHPSPGELVDDIGNDDQITEILVTGADTGDYPPAGTLRINRELFTYAATAMDGGDLKFTGVTRATDGTETRSHKAGDRVQECLRYEEVRVDALAREWLEDYARVPSEYIPWQEWQDEAALWLDQFEMSGLITEPTGVTQLLGEICEQALFYVWWDEREQLIKLHAIAPKIYEDVDQINDDQHIVADSVDIKDDPDSRVSQVWVFWGVRDPTESLTKDENYTRLRVRADLEAEAPEQYDEQKIRKIYSRWLRTEGQAINLSTRVLSRLRDTPRTMTLELDAKDRDHWTGDVVDVVDRSVVDFSGLPQIARWQILSAEEIEAGHLIKYVLDLYEFGVGLLFGRWMNESAPDFESATEQERLTGAWWADEDGKIRVDDETYDGYVWV